MWAALTLIRAWIAAGRPKGKKTLGKFEGWAGVMGGILQVADAPGFLDQLEAFRERADTETLNICGLVGTWAAIFGGQEITVGQLILHAGGLSLGTGSTRSQHIRLGQLLAGRQGQIFGGWTIEKTRMRSGSQLWRLTPADSTGQSPQKPDTEQDS